MFIALKDDEGARFAFLLQNGVVGRLENRRVHPGSSTDSVLKTGRPVLKRRMEDWTEGRIALNLPWSTQTDERISAIFVPLKFGASVIGVLSVQSNASNAYNEEDVALLQTCALYLSVRIHQAQLETQSARLENIAATDSLTGVANRRSFNQRFAAEWQRAVRRGSGLALLLIDIDFFKPFNDTYGHVAGDAALQQVANALSACLARSEDLFARYGGEEFVAVLPDTNLSGALSIAERMREAVFDLGIAHSGSLLQRLTISAGVAWKVPTRGTDSESLLHAADDALYQAKRSGRNRAAGENYRSDAPAAYPVRSYRHNLPEIRGHTFGRARDLQQLRKLLRFSPLLTIAGPAGVGKSREAIELARREMDRFPDGVFYVDCSTIADERYLLNRITAILGLPETPVVTPDSIVAEFLRSKHALIVLDNCDGATEAAARYLQSFSAQLREVRVLLTCRAPLMIPGEVSYVLPVLESKDAAALFFERAGIVADLDRQTTEIHTVEQICRQLEGLPRAIQLAAAQLSTFGLDELARQLPDSDGLGREALHGFVEWSTTCSCRKSRRFCAAFPFLPAEPAGMRFGTCAGPRTYSVRWSIKRWYLAKRRSPGSGTWFPHRFAHLRASGCASIANGEVFRSLTRAIFANAQQRSKQPIPPKHGGKRSKPCFRNSTTFERRSTLRSPKVTTCSSARNSRAISSIIGSSWVAMPPGEIGSKCCFPVPMRRSANCCGPNCCAELRAWTARALNVGWKPRCSPCSSIAISAKSGGWRQHCSKRRPHRRASEKSTAPIRCWTKRWKLRAA